MKFYILKQCCIDDVVANTVSSHRVLRSASRLVGRLPKFSSVTAYTHLRDVLHWLPTCISQRIQYRITAMVFRCVLRCAPSYLRDLCCRCQFWQGVGCCVLLRGVSF